MSYTIPYGRFTEAQRAKAFRLQQLRQALAALDDPDVALTAGLKSQLQTQFRAARDKARTKKTGAVGGPIR